MIGISWEWYLGLISFFTLVFTVFFAISFSVLMGVRDNYYRHYQKAELQWTNPDQEKTEKKVHWKALLTLSFVTSWIVVHFLIQS